jgi:hypothetical protein
MKKLGLRNYQLIASGVKMLGTYDPDEIFGVFIEDLLISQADTIEQFLRWVHENGKCFGSGNYEEVFAEFKKSTKGKKRKKKEQIPDIKDVIDNVEIVDFK